MKKIAIVLALTALMVSCGGRGPGKGTAGSGDKGDKTEQVTPDINVKPKALGYNVVAEYPHDEGAYTQGLLWHDGYLYEGTGQEGRSELRKVDIKTGRAVQSIKLKSDYFGEGIAMLDGLIYQLTWTEGRALVYDAADFRQVKSFSYDGEGWGLTTDGKKLYMSDGSDRIYVRDPETFAVEKIINVRMNGQPAGYLNELEWVEGMIWANVYSYTQEVVVVIDPASGSVVGMINFDGIRRADDVTVMSDVFNGIAYDPRTGRIFVTGKNWNKLYEVEVYEE